MIIGPQSLIKNNSQCGILLDFRNNDLTNFAKNPITSSITSSGVTFSGGRAIAAGAGSIDITTSAFNLNIYSFRIIFEMDNLSGLHGIIGIRHDTVSKESFLRTNNATIAMFTRYLGGITISLPNITASVKYEFIANIEGNNGFFWLKNLSNSKELYAISNIARTYFNDVCTALKLFNYQSAFNYPMIGKIDLFQLWTDYNFYKANYTGAIPNVANVLNHNSNTPRL